MAQAKTNPISYCTAGELLAGLGRIAAWRVRLNPAPGTADSEDLVRARPTRGVTCELIDRVIVEKPGDHLKGYIVAELTGHLGQYLKANDLGFLYGSRGWVRLAPGTVRSPDLCFTPWARMRAKFVPPVQIAKEVPELAIEVKGSWNTRGEILRKLKEYFLGWVRLVWVIDPRKRSAAVYTAPDKKTVLDDSDTLDGDDVLPGFRLPLAKLFARLEKPAPKKRKK
jgi:Uma2 family endonuclease